MDLKKFDKSFLTDKTQTIAGVDEAGRGPLAGPVVAAAVVFENGLFIPGINDSKKLSEKKRNELFIEITSQASSFGIGIVEHYEIDEINILQATLKAMLSAVEQLVEFGQCSPGSIPASRGSDWQIATTGPRRS